MSDRKDDLSEGSRKKLEFYLKFTPIVIILFIGLGYFHLGNYYSKFGIDILNYVGNTEILLSFLPLFRLFVIPVVGLTLIMYWTVESESKKDKDGDSPKNILGRLKQFFRLHVLSFLVVIMIFVSFLFLEELSRVYIGRGWAMLVFMDSLILASVMHTKKIKNERKRLIFFLLGMISFFLVPLTYNSSKYMGIVERERYMEVEFNYLDEPVVTNDTLLYVGQTTQVIFLFDRSNRKNLVYELSKVDHFSSKPIYPDFSWKQMFNPGRLRKDQR